MKHNRLIPSRFWQLKLLAKDGMRNKEQKG